jgi:uncharacterized membrane protein
MSFQTSTPKGGQAARNLGMMNYALLFGSIFFAGAPALIAVIIAYSQRDEAPPLAASHYSFQIRIFWVAFALSLVAGGCILALLAEVVGSLITFTGAHGWGRFETMTLDLSRLSIDGTLISLITGAAVSVFLATAWLVIAPGYGAIRLASEQGIGHSPAP